MLTLHNYFRSSTSTRLRAALNLKGLEYDYRPVSLLKAEQKAPGFLARNPAGLVPVLELGDGTCLTQSLAIIEYLDETHPEPPLLPADALGRARVRGLAYMIACEVHPLNNLRVLKYLSGELRASEDAVSSWYAHWISRGFGALETEVESESGELSLGDRPGMFEVMLVPQMFNARRFKVPLDSFPLLRAREERCADLPAFADAAPERQADAPENG